MGWLTALTYLPKVISAFKTFGGALKEQGVIQSNQQVFDLFKRLLGASNQTAPIDMLQILNRIESQQAEILQILRGQNPPPVA